MKTISKISMILFAATFSTFLASASELPVHGVPLDATSQVSELNENVLTIQKQIDELNSMQDALADVEDTDGLMSAIGQTVTQAGLSLQHIRKTSDLKESQQVTLDLAAQISEFKAMDPLNQILGLNVSDELHF